MGNNQLEIVKINLSNLIKECQTVYGLLQKDQPSFVHDRFTEIDLSNQQKILALTNLSILINQMSDLCPEGINSYLQTQVKDDAIKKELLKQDEQLKKEIHRCFNLLTINQGVVDSSLNLLKRAWEKAIHQKLESHVYDREGNKIASPA